MFLVQRYLVFFFFYKWKIYIFWSLKNLLNFSDRLRNKYELFSDVFLTSSTAYLLRSNMWSYVSSFTRYQVLFPFRCREKKTPTESYWFDFRFYSNIVSRSRCHQKPMTPSDYVRIEEKLNENLLSPPNSDTNTFMSGGLHANFGWSDGGIGKFIDGVIFKYYG